jgi:hemolysin activation/secretion protein
MIQSLALIVFILMLPLSTLHAQPSSGSLLQEIESQPDLRSLPQVVPKTPLAPPPLDRTKDKKYYVKNFVFKGNTVISSKELTDLLKNYVNQSLSFAQLQSAAAAISELYRDRGWLVRSFLPTQDISDGTVIMQIIEAKFGGLKINNQSKRMTNKKIELWAEKNIPIHSLLSLNHVDRLILLLTDLPGVKIVGTLQAGKNAGETLLYVTVTDTPIITGQIAADNFGDPSTGIIRTSASASMNGALGFNEQVSLYGIYSDGSNYGRLSLSAPVGQNGLRLGVNGSFMNYRVINPAFTDLHASGEARTVGLEAMYPIVRSRQTNLFAQGNYSKNDFYNTNINGTSSQYNTTTYQFGLSGNRIDNFGRGGINTGSMLFSVGQVNLNNSPSQAFDSIGPQVEGAFTKMRYALNRVQAINSSFSMYGALTGQVANKNLDPSEQIYMGGPFNVRAYSMGQGAASQANLTTIELRMNLPAQFQLGGFYDYANVQTYKTTAFDSAPENNYYALQGGGVNLSWNGPLNSQLKATWARRTGTLPDAIQTYMNQNGGLSANRYWLTGTLPF